MIFQQHRFIINYTNSKCRHKDMAKVEKYNILKSKNEKVKYLKVEIML